MRAGTGPQANEARAQARDEQLNLRPPQLTPHGNRPRSINRVRLEHVPGRIAADRGHRLQGWRPSWVSATAPDAAHRDAESASHPRHQSRPLAQSRPDAGVQDRRSRRHGFRPDGRRIHRIMAAHLQEATVMGPVPAHDDRSRRRLRSARHRTDGSTDGGQAALSSIPRVQVPLKTAKARSCASNIEAIAAPSLRARWPRLLHLARAGADEDHPAVAEPDMRRLHRHGDAVDRHHPFVGAAVHRTVP
jgi:hypothetical protein